MKTTSFPVRLAAAASLELLAVADYAAGPLHGALPAGFILAASHIAACFLFASAAPALAGEAFKAHPGLARAFVLGFSLPLPAVGPLTVCAFLRIIRDPPPEKTERRLYMFGESEIGLVKKSGPEQRQLLTTAAEIMNQRDSEARRNAILAMTADGTISGKIAKELFDIVWTEGGDPRDIVKARGTLEEAGVKFDGQTVTVEGYVSTATFYDPDGNALMLAQDLTS